MGGVLIVFSIGIATLLCADVRNPMVWLALLALNFFGLIGGIDDFLKVSRRQNLGLRSRHKLGLQLLVAAGIGCLLIAGAMTMPPVCYLSAWRKSFRHLFFIPVLCLVLGVAMFLREGMPRESR